MMFPSLKHICLLACAAAMVASCTGDAPSDPAKGRGAEVTFDVAPLTRAAATTSFTEFAVFGDMRHTAVDDPSTTTVFDNTVVTYAIGKWTYEGAQYWFPNHEHSFVAIAPLTVLDAAGAPKYENSVLSFTYTLPTDGNNAVIDSRVTDIVAATHRRLYREGDAVTSVSLQFSHLLSQINFSLELTDPVSRSEECFKIHKMEMTGFGTSATINVEPASLQSTKQTNDSKIDIVTANGNGSLTVTFDEPIEVINGASAINMFDGNHAIIMLPQTFTATENVEIHLTYSVNDDEETTEVSGALTGITWESGKSYNYKIKLELDEAKEANMVVNGAIIAPWTLIEDPVKVDAR